MVKCDPGQIDVIKNKLEDFNSGKLKASPNYKKRLERFIKSGESTLKKMAKKEKIAQNDFKKLNPNLYFGDEVGETFFSSRVRSAVYLPLGRLSFADKVIKANHPDLNVLKLNNVIGTPDVIEDNGAMTVTGEYSIGKAGTLIVQFTDNALTDVNGPDLYIFEIGKVEPTNLEISKDGISWLKVGKIDGGVSEVDIAEFVQPGDLFYYVRLTDLKQRSALPGADVDAIAATAGPGLIGGVMVGLVTGKALAMASGKPLVAVNHLEGHALSPRLSDPELEFPYLLLLVSGGHCQILRVEGVNKYRRLATTIDDAAGEAFDKTAKILGLGYPGGPKVEKLAAKGNAEAVPLPRPLLGSKEPHFSFAGLKSAVVRAYDSGKYNNADIAAAFQQAAVDCLKDRMAKAIREHEPVNQLVVAGGVAANGPIRAMLEQLATEHDMQFTAPPLWLCTDNAAMIAWAALKA